MINILFDIANISFGAKVSKKFVDYLGLMSNFIIDNNKCVLSCFNLEAYFDANFKAPNYTKENNGLDLEYDPANFKLTFTRYDFTGHFNFQNRTGYFLTNNPINLQSYLRIVFSFLLLEESGFLVHAASFIKDGKGYLFPGKSGAGKTTIARMRGDAILLSDEISLLKKIGDTYYLFGTPFHGDIGYGGENVSVPISAVYFHEKDTKVFKQPISDAQTLGKLLQTVVFWGNNDLVCKKLFDICADFVEQNIPSYELHFLPEPSFWGIVD